jgi:hypothetical protein
MLQFRSDPSSAAAVVSRTDKAGTEYLRVRSDGATDWVADPSAATPFGSMKEAARVAVTLPAELRAFGMPLQIERQSYQLQGVH